MNMDRWNSLPDDVKKVMDDLRVEQAEWTGNYMDNHVKESIEWSKKTYQVEFIELPPNEKSKWDAKLQSITEKWISDTKSKGFPAEQIVGDIKGLIKKHGG
jgi:TRAP-type C4-dicarboxylate transport system substrate-binding protein